MKTLLYYALAVLFGMAAAASFIYATAVPKGYGFALVTIGTIAMHGYHVLLNKAGD